MDLQVVIKDGKTYADRSDLHEWKKNPRGVKKEDFARLLKQIKKHGQYKPLIVTREGTVIGGNMRLKAYKKEGITQVWVSVVDAPTEAIMLEYALSDNDRIGYYEEEALAELTLQYRDELELEVYKLDLGKPLSLDQFVDRYGPDDNGDKKDKKYQSEFQVVVECKDEAEQENVYDKLLEQGMTCKILTL